MDYLMSVTPRRTTLILMTHSQRLAGALGEVCDLLDYVLVHTTDPRDRPADLAILDLVNESFETVQLWSAQLHPQTPLLYLVSKDQASTPKGHVLRSPFRQTEAIRIIQRILHNTRFVRPQRVSEGFLHALLGATSDDEILHAMADYLCDIAPIARVGVLRFDDNMRHHWIFWENPPTEAAQEELVTMSHEDRSGMFRDWHRWPLQTDQLGAVVFLQIHMTLTTQQYETLTEAIRVSGRVWAREAMLRDNELRIAEVKVYDLIGRAIVAQSDSQAVLQVIINSARASLYASGAVLWLKRKGHLVAVALSGTPQPVQRYLPVGGNVLSHVMQQATPLITELSPTDASIYPVGSVHRTICVPLVSSKQTIGVIQANNPAGHNWFKADNEWRLRQLASWSVIAINNAELYHRTHTALQRERAAHTRAVEAEKLTALGRLVAAVAHEVNNPLQIAQSALEWTMNTRYVLDEVMTENLQTVQDAIDQISEVIQNLRDTYRENDEQRAVDLNQMVQQLTEMVSFNARQKRIDLCLDLDSSLPLARCVPHEIRQVLLNLLLNAIDAVDERGDICVRTTHDPTNSEICIIVEDNGEGIPDDVMASIFEPFFTTKREGSGLGLAISREIIEQHRGHITAASVRGSGTKFMVWLPVG